MSVSLFAVALGVSSCGGFMGVDFTDQASVDENMRKNLEKFVDPEASVLEITFMSANDFTMTLGNAMVAHFAPDDDELLYYNVMLGGIDKDEPTKAHGSLHHLSGRKPESGVKLKDIDFSKIASNIAQAVEMMKEAEYDCDGIGSYEIELNSDPTKVVHKFELQSISGKEYGRKGRNTTVTTNYYKFDFEADADGNVVYVE